MKIQIYPKYKFIILPLKTVKFSIVVKSYKKLRMLHRDSDSSCHRGNKRKRAKVYHSLPMSYGELLPILSQNYGIFIIPVRPRRPPYPKGYDVNAIYEYHGGVGEHSVENCKALKDKIQSLIYADPIKFRELINGHQEH